MMPNTMHNQPAAAEWNTAAPYTAMLHAYKAASEKLLHRIAVLREELRGMQNEKAGTLASARKQTLLELRIQTLRTEYEDTCDIIAMLRGYAGKEVRS